MTNLTFDEAYAQITAPGQPFAVTTATIRGRDYSVFEHAAPHLPAMFATSGQRGDTDFLIYEDEHWTFADVVAHGHAMAATLVADYGIGKGDRVAIAMRNYPEWITSFVGILAAGAVAVPLNAWWTTDELLYGLRDSGSTVVIADQERLDRVAAQLSDAGVRAIVVRSESTGEGIARYDDVVVPGTAAPEVSIDPDDDATILYTSGTTGNPKGAVGTHRAHTHALMSFWCKSQVNDLVRSTSGDPVDDAVATPETPKPRTSYILTVPLFHVTGCVPVMLGSFALGFKLVMMYKWDPRRALELVEREKVTDFVGVPTMVQDILEVPDFASFDTSSLKSVGGGGAAASPQLVQRVANSFAKGAPGIGYGMTETTAYGPQNSGPEYLLKPSSAGRTIPVMQVKVVDEVGNELPQGQQGEICFYGPNLIREYWNKPEATADAFYDGWLRSGDLGRIDEDGFVFVEDRAKDMVIRAGENIGCIEVEAAIAEHPAVYEVAVFGLPHERLGEELACSIYLRPGHSVTGVDITEHVRARLASFKIPTVIEISEGMLPRSAQGKILKREIRDRLAKDRAQA